MTKSSSKDGEATAAVRSDKIEQRPAFDGARAQPFISAEEGQSDRTEIVPTDDRRRLIPSDGVRGTRPQSESEHRLRWPGRDQKAVPSMTIDRPTQSESGPEAEEATQLVRAVPPAMGAAQLASAGQSDSERAKSILEVGPVVGWLVVVAGPGVGRSVEITSGVNSIGRGTGEQLRLNFGDSEIHRERHAVVIYDPKSRRFFIKAGDVRNLTYVDEQLLLEPTELKGGEAIIIGQTRLSFVPFCGPAFGWT